MASKYDDDGNFIGTIVENLTDGSFPKIRPIERFASFKMGERYPSRALDPFQAEMYNSKLVFGTRTVWHRTFGTVFQALVKSFDELAWINVEKSN